MPNIVEIIEDVLSINIDEVSTVSFNRGTGRTTIVMRNKSEHSVESRHNSQREYISAHSIYKLILEKGNGSRKVDS